MKPTEAGSVYAVFRTSPKFMYTPGHARLATLTCLIPDFKERMKQYVKHKAYWDRLPKGSHHWKAQYGPFVSI